MKRSVLVILVLLLCGAIVNMAVSWGLALSVDLESLMSREEFGGPLSGPTYHDWTVYAHKRSGVSRFRSSWWSVVPGQAPARPPEGDLRSLVFDWADAATPEHHSATGHSQYALAWQYGWPMPALGGLVYCEDSFNGSVAVVYHNCFATMPDALQNQYMLDETRLIGWKPIWPGFAINTVFYAAVLWMLFAAPFALRKWRRIRRGLCPKCGYDLRGGGTDSATCPECGAAVVRSFVNRS
jgi:hypothetical protein